MSIDYHDNVLVESTEDRREYLSISFVDDVDSGSIILTRYAVPGRYAIYSFRLIDRGIVYSSEGIGSMAEHLNQLNLDLSRMEVLIMICTAMRVRNNWPWARSMMDYFLPMVAPNFKGIERLQELYSEEITRRAAIFASKSTESKNPKQID